MEENKIITLRKPVKLGDVEYASLELREPTAGELAKSARSGGSLDMAISLIHQVAKVPVKVVESLCQRDFQEASDFLGSFDGMSQGTGEMSSPS